MSAEESTTKRGRRKGWRKAGARTEYIALRVRADESLAFRMAASNASMTLADWIRKACRDALFPERS